MWILDPNRLLPGDVVLESGRGLGSGFIKWVGETKYSHALIWVGNAHFIEAVPLGAIFINFSRVTFRDPAAVAVLRHPDAKIAAAAANEARNLAHKPYNMRDLPRFAWAKILPGAGLPSSPYGSTYLFCSQLVAEAFRRAGSDLVPGLAPMQIDPGKLSSASVLKPVNPVPILEQGEEYKRRLGMNYDRHKAYKDAISYKELRITARVASKLKKRFKDIDPKPNNVIEMILVLRDHRSMFDDKLPSDLQSLLEAEGYFSLIKEAAAKLLQYDEVMDDQVSLWREKADSDRLIALEYRALAASDPLPLWTWMANGYEGNARLLDQVIAHYRPSPP